MRNSCQFGTRKLAQGNVLINTESDLSLHPPSPPVINRWAFITMTSRSSFGPFHVCCQWVGEMMKRIKMIKRHRTCGIGMHSHDSSLCLNNKPTQYIQTIFVPCLRCIIQLLCSLPTPVWKQPVSVPSITASAISSALCFSGGGGSFKGAQNEQTPPCTLRQLMT